ncbi:MAG: adenosyl-hopene transferase HpnH [Desulfuromonadia bacterium]
MRFPLRLTLDLTWYLLRCTLTRQRRYPLVLMLEPTHRCNLACSGCGRIREYGETLSHELSLERCLEAVDECPAPVVTVTGGEPLLYGSLPDLLSGIISRRRHIQLCTNGLLLSDRIHTLPHHPNLTINVHLDGLAATHDRIIDSPGGFSRAWNGIEEALRRRVRVCTNTTIFRETDLDEIRELFQRLTRAGVAGILVAPGFDYDAVDGNLFLQREEIRAKFREILRWSTDFPFWSTPPYLRFLAGVEEMECTPWGNPTVNPLGWKAPCYLITDTHYPRYREMMEQTDWDRYGVGKDPRCAQCMMHCGFEPTVVRTTTTLGRIYEMIRWNLS